MEENKENTTKNSIKTRSKGFPVLSLPEAVKIIRDAGNYGKVMTPSALANYAGHQTATSGPWKQKASSLREWGLIATLGPDKVGLTDRALKIAYPDSPEDAQKAMLACFEGYSLFMAMYDDLAKGVDLDLNVIGNKALTTYGIAIASKDKFVKSFVESAAAVGLAERVGTDKLRMLAAESSDDSDTETREADASTAQRSPDARTVVQTVGTPVLHQTWEFNQGNVSVSINSTQPFQAATYGELSKVIEAVENLVEHLGPKTDAIEDVSE